MVESANAATFIGGLCNYFRAMSRSTQILLALIWVGFCSFITGGLCAEIVFADFSKDPGKQIFRDAKQWITATPLEPVVLILFVGGVIVFYFCVIASILVGLWCYYHWKVAQFQDRCRKNAEKERSIECS